MLSLQKGLTFVELLVVLGIISVLAAVAYPQYQEYIRRGRQLEAKTNLGVVYQKQLSYFSSELKFSASLRTLGAVPKGRIRYNIGTDWAWLPEIDGLPLGQSMLVRGNASNDLCPCHNDQRGKNPPTNKECWADPHPEGTQPCSSSSAKICFGRIAGKGGRKMKEQVRVSILNSGGNPNDAAIVTENEFSITGGTFEYYAVGCTTPRLRNTRLLDIWSINHKKNLRNVKPGLEWN